MKYFNLKIEGGVVRSVPVYLFIDLGIGGGYTRVEGTIVETYDYGYWSKYIVNPHYHDSSRSVMAEGAFGGAAVRLGIQIANKAVLAMKFQKMNGPSIAGGFPLSNATLSVDLAFRLGRGPRLR